MDEEDSTVVMAVDMEEDTDAEVTTLGDDTIELSLWSKSLT